MKNLRLAPLGCALLLALAAPVHAWSVQDKSGNTQIKLTDDGKLGVGMTPPSGSSAKLEVAGQVKITGGSPGAGKVLTSDGNGLASWQYPPGYLPPGYISQGGLIWMPVNSSSSVTWPVANAYCTNTAINGQTGWRMPTRDELIALCTSGAINGQWGPNDFAPWSSTVHSSVQHDIVGLLSCSFYWGHDVANTYQMSCVRAK